MHFHKTCLILEIASSWFCLKILFVIGAKGIGSLVNRDLVRHTFSKMDKDIFVSIFQIQYSIFNISYSILRYLNIGGSLWLWKQSPFSNEHFVRVWLDRPFLMDWHFFDSQLICWQNKKVFWEKVYKIETEFKKMICLTLPPQPELPFTHLKIRFSHVIA